MGLDLTLLPLRGFKEVNSSVLCYDRLSFDRDYDIFGQIIDCGEDRIKPSIETNRSQIAHFFSKSFAGNYSLLRQQIR
jgi:hypothetical protein